MNKVDLLEKVNNGGLDGLLGELYGQASVPVQRSRVFRAIEKFNEAFCECDDVRLFRSPGRIEIGGNHTDHQHGQVLAAAIDRDILAVVSGGNGSNVNETCGCKICDTKIQIYSEGFGQITVDVSECDEGAPDRYESGTAQSLIQGVVCCMRNRGYEAGGFCAYLTSEVPGGSGLSSSAAFELLIGTILNDMYNDGGLSAEELALIGQEAENNYYGKPCGLMDQMTCASGGICHIDFRRPKVPANEKLDVDLAKLGYAVCITDTHGSHADYTDDYAAILKDLRAAAGVFGKEVLEGVSVDDVISNAEQIRMAGGDRAFLRALHVATENMRVSFQVRALKDGDINDFLDLVSQSGNSSSRWLQNVYSSDKTANQELTVALALSEAWMQRSNGACRVHGGGFAGTILTVLPEEDVPSYQKFMDEAFGEGSCYAVRICPRGAMRMV